MSSAAIGVIGAVGLAGCTAEPEDEAPWRALGTTPLLVHAARLELEPLPPGPLVETPDSTYQVTATALLPSFTQEELDELFRVGSPPHDGLTAAEGTVFLLATFREEYLEDRRWPAAADVVTRRRIRFTDSAGDRAALELDPARRQEEWLLQVPADPAAEEAVLEFEIGGRIRRLSLVDGSLVRDDLAYLEDRPRGLSVQTGTAEHEWLYEAEAVDEDGATDAAGLDAGDGILVPVSGTLGRPAEGTLLAGVTVHHDQHFTPAEEQLPGSGRPEPMPLPTRPEGCTLTLPDGTVIPQSAMETVVEHQLIEGVFAGGSHRVWFEVPVGFESATVQLRLSLCPRRAGLAEILGMEAGAEARLTATDEQER
ncbi:hypothetical protein CFK38_03710 [Brachybacterium vulturis]|uniref:Uncharacterized protein n=1 Tax=Brachybacterium vulturis TaxID=2017484 RepID=A0A291GL87_9MICO|nr:hypothetical protein [Brachybacterium vulturis]ATG50724.1 hypothetical protein CFK38_03710 [Brachybacterium vulturis]